jgi:hypothetical protein
MKREETNRLAEIVEADLPEIERLAQAFGWITASYVEHAQGEIELARAMGDPEAVIREQIKMEMMKHARSIFQDVYRQVTRRSAWGE